MAILLGLLIKFFGEDVIKKNVKAVCFGLAIFPSVALSGGQVSDGRSHGMGNTGVASSEYLTASFYNPALITIKGETDDFGILIPTIGIQAKDSDGALSLIEDLQDSIEDYENKPDVSIQADLNSYLDKLTGHSPLILNAEGGFAVAVPFEELSLSVYGSGFVEVMARADVSTSSLITTRYQNTNVDIVALGYSEFGLALAKQFTISNQVLSFGVTPKFQSFETKYENVSLKEFDVGEHGQNTTTNSAFNLDLGVVWLKNNVRTAFVAKNIIKQSIKTSEQNGKTFTYELTPELSMGVSYHHAFFTVTADADLTAKTRYKGVKDDTQFVRFGAEGNAWDWAQLRVGYEVDTKGTLDNSYTIGLGLSPFNVVNLDLAANYDGENQYGASGSLSFTF